MADSSHDSDYNEEDSMPSSQSGAGRTLGGDSVPSRPVASSSGRGSQAKQPRKKFASLRDFEADGGGQGHGSGDEDSDRGQDYYAGGDKSGLAVKDPAENNGRDHNMVQKLLETARRGASRGTQDDGPSRPQSRFTGTGQTLGGDDAPSQLVPDPNEGTQQQGQEQPIERILHLWADGFSVDDGPLYRYDDPANEATLDMINRGAAPLELMNVRQGQEVDVKLLQHRGENYVKPKPKYKPFSGGGQRLGSPTPGASGSSASNAPLASTATSGSSGAPTAASVEVDDSQPTISLQIRLGDGTRLQSRFNTTHTVGDVYSFVLRASPESAERSFALMTTFPTKELSDQSQVLGEMPEFKRGGVIVQKWQ